MKICILRFLALCAFLYVSSANLASVKKDRTITKVVKLLQGMLDKSKAEGEEETEIYGKFHCYCLNNERAKKASVESLTDTIQVLESKMAAIQGETGELSSDCADLKTAIAENKQARADAKSLRDKEHKAFLAEEDDLKTAINQMKRAIETLSAVGADQTKSTGADNKQFMAGKSLLSLGEDVQLALKAASGIMDTEQRKTASAFLQAPFTGTYTSQSAQVLGIIKNMRDTFKKNLADARETEKTAKEAYDKFMEEKEKAFKEMTESYKEKQKQLGGNDEELSSKKKQLAQAQKQKASDEEFLSKLIPMCEDKTKAYENRKLLRANEEAAIAEAISILNSDEAFETFGTTDATKTGKTGLFLQLRSVRKHLSGHDSTRRQVQSVLQQANSDAHSSRLLKVLSMVKAENPFDTVLTEIEKMIKLIAEEAKADKTNLDWCNSERKENNDSLDQKKKEIVGLESKIDKLTIAIDDPKTGLKKQIENTELQLIQNDKSQKDETAERTEDNVAYQADISNLVSAEGILKKALKVLKAYYDDLEKKLAAGEAFVQREDPKPPEAWKGDGAYEGQSGKGGDVVKMLEFILSQTVKEEMTAHADEEKAQADYEDSMAELKKEQANAEKSLTNLQETLAEKQQELLEAQDDLKATVKDKEEIEAYLLKIKPGCDFITKNFKLREANRKTEKDALEKAVRLIKGTPAYKTAVNQATVESYGDCKEPCVEDADHVKCKACMADVTVPAYCAGHKGTKGC